MQKTAFKALTEGQRVLVSGKQDNKTFAYEPGRISNVETHRDIRFVTIRFDRWTEGHGFGAKHWVFNDYQARNYTITAESPVAEAPKPAKKAPHGKQEYKGNGKHYWVKVTGETFRLRVPGGWLYRDMEEPATSLAFVPVPEVVGYKI